MESVARGHASASGHLNEKTIGHPKKLKTPKMKRKRDMYSDQRVFSLTKPHAFCFMTYTVFNKKRIPRCIFPLTETLHEFLI